jgi:hypothetical protein
MTRQTAKGQGKGAAQAQQGFLSDSRGLTGPSAVLPPEQEPQPIPVEGFGDFTEAVFAPTDRPGESIFTSVDPMAQRKATPTPADFIRLAQDPAFGDDFRGMMSLAALAQNLGAGVRVQ